MDLAKQNAQIPWFFTTKPQPLGIGNRKFNLQTINIWSIIWRTTPTHSSFNDDGHAERAAFAIPLCVPTVSGVGRSVTNLEA